MTPNLHLWLIPVLPLLGAAVNGLLGKKFSRQTVAAVALLFSGAAPAMVLLVAYRFSSLTTPHIRSGYLDFSGRLLLLSRPAFAGSVLVVTASAP